jgi:predicted metal-dependent HD superfamily phosphohydrolase
VLTDIEEVEQLIASWAVALDDNLCAYRNHVYRVINLCVLQRKLSGEELRQVVLAACFHDVAIWLDDTFDYLAPSRDHAQRYLQQQGLEGWGEPVGAMIEQHHKITPYRGNELVETFRRADWIDVSLGRLKYGVSAANIRAVRQTFPNGGFHRFLLRRIARELITRPWNPLPMMRW